MAVYIIKVQISLYDGLETYYHRLRIDQNDNYLLNFLNDLLKRHDGLETIPVRIFWIDHEGDTISIREDDDLRTFVEMKGTKVFIEKYTSSATPPLLPLSDNASNESNFPEATATMPAFNVDALSPPPIPEISINARSQKVESWDDGISIQIRIRKNLPKSNMQSSGDIGQKNEGDINIQVIKSSTKTPIEKNGRKCSNIRTAPQDQVKTATIMSFRDEKSRKREKENSIETSIKIPLNDSSSSSSSSEDDETNTSTVNSRIKTPLQKPISSMHDGSLDKNKMTTQETNSSKMLREETLASIDDSSPALYCFNRTDFEIPSSSSEDSSSEEDEVKGAVTKSKINHREKAEPLRNESSSECDESNILLSNASKKTFHEKPSSSEESSSQDDEISSVDHEVKKPVTKSSRKDVLAKFAASKPFLSSSEDSSSEEGEAKQRMIKSKIILRGNPISLSGASLSKDDEVTKPVANSSMKKYEPIKFDQREKPSSSSEESSSEDDEVKKPVTKSSLKDLLEKCASSKVVLSSNDSELIKFVQREKPSSSSEDSSSDEEDEVNSSKKNLLQKPISSDDSSSEEEEEKLLMTKFRAKSSTTCLEKPASSKIVPSSKENEVIKLVNSSQFPSEDSLSDDCIEWIEQTSSDDSSFVACSNLSWPLTSFES
jgi:hypothetical protein